MKTANELANKLMILHIAQAHEWSSSATSDAAAMLRSQAAEIEALRKANIDCKLHFDTLKADYDALKADAERYKFLRNQIDGWYIGPAYSTYNDVVCDGVYMDYSSGGVAMDTAVDAAMKGTS